MATQQEKATLKLRELILGGDFAPGAWLRETAVALQLGTSRTPARIAMQILEQEGLLGFIPNRGFRVEKFTVQQVSDAVDVRGTLEGMACRLAARRGLAPALTETLQSCLTRGREILRGASFDEADTQIWADMNRTFHDGVVEAAANEALAANIAFNNRIPLASAAAITFYSYRADLGLSLLREAQRDHEEIFAAICDGESDRAESLMREHARRSRDNKLRFLRDVRSSQIFDSIPGSKLVVS